MEAPRPDGGTAFFADLLLTDLKNDFLLTTVTDWLSARGLPDVREVAVQTPASDWVRRAHLRLYCRLMLRGIPDMCSYTAFDRSDPDAGADDKQLSNAFSGASRGVSQMKVVIRMDALLRPADNEAEHGEDDDLPAYAFVHAAEAEKTIMQMGKLATTNTTSARNPIAYRALVLLTLKAVTQSKFEAMTKLHILTYALRLRALVRNNVTSAVDSAEELNLLRSVFYSDVKSDLKEIDDLPSCAQVDEVAVASISDIQEQFLALCNGACRETDVLDK